MYSFGKRRIKRVGKGANTIERIKMVREEKREKEEDKARDCGSMPTLQDLSKTIPVLLFFRGFPSYF